MNYTFNWEMILSGQYLDWLVEGVQTSLSLIVVSAVIAFAFGMLVALARLSRHPVLRVVSSAYVELCRNIPTLIWIYIFFFVAPALFPSEISYAINRAPQLPYVAAVAGIALSSSGYIGEILRGGIQAVPSEQSCAAYSLGMSKPQVWWHIVWPQALSNCFPALVNRIIHNTQNTSLAMAISVHEIMWATQQIQSITFHGIETMLLATVFFVICCVVLQLFARVLERLIMPSTSAIR